MIRIHIYIYIIIYFSLSPQDVSPLTPITSPSHFTVKAASLTLGAVPAHKEDGAVSSRLASRILVLVMMFPKDHIVKLSIRCEHTIVYPNSEIYVSIYVYIPDYIPGWHNWGQDGRCAETMARIINTNLLNKIIPKKIYYMVETALRNDIF